MNFLLHGKRTSVLHAENRSEESSFLSFMLENLSKQNPLGTLKSLFEVTAVIQGAKARGSFAEFDTGMAERHLPVSLAYFRRCRRAVWKGDWL